MKNRRSFLKMLGLGAVAAPVAAKVAMEAPAVPEAISPGAINAAARQFMAMNAGHTHTITPSANQAHTHSMSSYDSIWIYDGKGWTARRLT